MSLVLETENLTKRFGGLTAVNGVNFQLQEGELKAVIGPNGAGKTTFFNLLTGALPPTEGSITLNGREITNLEPYEIARLGVGRSFQISNLFTELTVLENVRLGIQIQNESPKDISYYIGRAGQNEETIAEAEEIVSKVRLSEETDKKVSELAHGKKRQLEVALTLSIDPEVILLDEPAAGLTPEETTQLIDIIESVAEERTIMLIDHDVDFITDISDTIAVLHQGEIIADGTPEEVQADDEVQRVYLGGGA
jgi:branched-chain amino acid transport system ATP-binding protein